MSEINKIKEIYKISEFDDEDIDKCMICLKTIDEVVEFNEFNYIMKCSKCSFKSCSECITKWYNTTYNRLKCPQCREIMTFDVDYGDDGNGTERRQEFLLNMIENDIFGRIMNMEIVDLPPLSENIQNNAEFPSLNFRENIWDTIPWQHKQRWEYRPIFENRELVRYRIMLKKQFNPDYIYNPSSGRYVKKLGKEGKKILNEIAGTEMVFHPEIPDKILNPDTGRWVDRYGRTGDDLRFKYDVLEELINEGNENSTILDIQIVNNSNNETVVI